MRISSGGNDIQFLGMSGPLASSSTSTITSTSPATPLFRPYTPKRKSPSSTSSMSHIPPPTKKAKTSSSATEPQEDESFVVERLMARSSYKTFSNVTNRREHHYLVRWEGYSPAHDTWEPRSCLAEGAAELLLDFDSRDHPVIILDKRNTRPETYLVRYSVETDTVPASPYAQTMWHAKAQMAFRRDISSAAIDEAVRDFEQRQTGLPTPPVSAKASPPRKIAPPADQPKRGQKGRVLIELLDKRQRKAKTVSWKKSQYFLARYTEGKRTRTEWFPRNKLNKWWGEHASEMIRQWNEDAAAAKRGDNAAPPSDYDLERLRNIDENRALLKDLGIAM